MFPSVFECLLLLLFWIPSECQLDQHRQFQYNSQVDGRGTYNFAYDTSHKPSDAHSLHMEYRDASGIVRGRYGYTDPRGNLRIVEYEAGPDGYKARGDVGPDLFPHMEAPGLQPQKPDPAPTPLRMAGLDPETNSITKGVVMDNVYYYPISPEAVRKPQGGYVKYSGGNQVYSGQLSYPPVTQTKEPDVEIFQQRITTNENLDSAPTPLQMAGWDPETNPINERVVADNAYYYPISPAALKKPARGYVRYADLNQIYSSKPSYSPVTQTEERDVEVFEQQITPSQKKSKPLTQSQPLTIYNIDVDPDEIRVAGPPVGSGERRSVQSSVPAYPQRSVDILTTSPEITYYERSAIKGTSESSHHHHDQQSYPRQSPVRTSESSHHHHDQQSYPRQSPIRSKESSHHHHDLQSYPRQKLSSSYHSHAQTIQRPRPVRYSAQPHSHGTNTQYHFH